MIVICSTFYWVVDVELRWQDETFPSRIYLLPCNRETRTNPFSDCIPARASPHILPRFHSLIHVQLNHVPRFQRLINIPTLEKYSHDHFLLNEREIYIRNMIRGTGKGNGMERMERGEGNLKSYDRMTFAPKKIVNLFYVHILLSSVLPFIHPTTLSVHHHISPSVSRPVLRSSQFRFLWLASYLIRICDETLIQA